MASTYSSRLKLELIGTGEQSGTWGDTTNTNLGTLLDEAIAGVASITMTDADYTLTSANGATDQARKAVLVMSGTLSASRNVICPTSQKVYIIKNSTTGGFAITLKTASGTGVSIPNGATYLVYCDGTNVVSGGSYQPLDGDLTAISAISTNGILTRTGSDTWATVAAPTGTVVGTSDSQTLTNKTIDGANNTITNVSLSSGVTGTLAVGKGGTGLSTVASKSILVTNALDTFSVLTPTAGQSIRLNAGGTAWEAYTPSTGSGTVTSVSGTGTVSGLTLTGTVTSTGSLTLGGTLAVTPSNFASQTANTFLAAPNGSAGTPTFRALVAADITGAVAIANGGTGQTSKAAAYNALTPITSTGDLVIGNGANSATRLAIGTNGQVLQSNGTTAVWATASGGDLSLISTQTMSGDSPSALFTGLTANNYLVSIQNVYAAGGTGGGGSVIITFYAAGSQLTSDYTLTRLVPNGSYVSPSNTGGLSSLTYPDVNGYASGLLNVSYFSSSNRVSLVGTLTGTIITPVFGRNSSVTTSFTGIKIQFSSFTTTSGRVSLYKLNT